MTWQLLERYREVIVYAADLLSFILVTPQLLKYSELAIRRIVYWVGSLLFSFSALGLPYGIGIIIIAVVIVLGFLLEKTYVSPEDWWKKHGEEISNWISARAFAFGVCLFFASRLFALVLSLHALAAE
jgi:hypothetical protein